MASSDLRGLVWVFFGGGAVREEVESYHKKIPHQLWSILMGPLSLFVNWAQKTRENTSYYGEGTSGLKSSSWLF